MRGGPVPPAFDTTERVRAVSRLVAPGEWTTYGEVARVALGIRGARVVGRLAARENHLANAHRILLAGGRIAPAWGGGRAAACQRRLESEGVHFSGGRADPARHLTYLDLAGRLELEARLARSTSADEAAELGVGAG